MSKADLIVWIAAALCIRHLWPVWYGLLWPRRLTDVPPANDEAALPLMSVIVPARDEAAGVEAALRSLLLLDYPRFEIIAIDDRSTDATGEIMDRVAAHDAVCRVIHVRKLPAGWLGKNHANSIGADAANGELILFTDGDVLFGPDVLRRAVGHMQRGAFDHLAVLPDALMTTFGEQLLMNYFVVQFGMITRLAITHFRWARKAFVGVGAFNMIRREAYERIGGHERLRMEVADDMMLGKLVKEAGMHQDAMMGAPLVRVKWQTGMWGIIRGLEKNAFAGARYSVPLVVVSIVAHLVLAWAPIALIVAGPARWPAATLLAMIAATHLGSAWQNHYRPAAALLFPVAALLFCYVMIRSTRRTLRDGGVRWRDTFYPLAELRAGMIEWRPLGGFFRARRRSD